MNVYVAVYRWIDCRNAFRNCSDVYVTNQSFIQNGWGGMRMRKRNVPVMFRLNRKEAEALDKKVKKSGLNREAYLRQLITGVVPKDAPPPDYYSMMRELHKIGNNLNQIAQKAHTLNVIDVQRYDVAMRMFEKTVKEITEAVILPEKTEGRGIPQNM